MTNIERVENYLYRFFEARFDDFDDFYRNTHQERRSGIYNLKDGSDLMDYLHNIHGNIENIYFSEKLVPEKFATPDLLFQSLNIFKAYLNNNQNLIDSNKESEIISPLIAEIENFKNSLVYAIDYAKQIYDIEDVIMPYQDLRYSLLTNNIPEFIKILNSILSSVSYAITKSKEGYHHSNVHLILKLIGFDVLSEEQTNTGRIDAVVRFIDSIYILEFKFQKSEDKSQEALDQIKAKEYANKYFVEKKRIYVVGISFSEELRNVNGYKSEEIFY
jgi:hypothetical protein